MPKAKNPRTAAPPLRYSLMPSPVGELVLAGDDQGLHQLRFSQGKGANGPAPEWQRDDRLLAPVRQQLSEYFDGTRRHFELTLVPVGTAFQRAVWQALTEIPYGETRSYGELARRIGRPKAVRAVGAANGANPLPIVVPCHRVIGSNGTLTGFGGGLSAKEYLLGLEGVRVPAPELLSTP